VNESCSSIRSDAGGRGTKRIANEINSEILLIDGDVNATVTGTIFGKECWTSSRTLQTAAADRGCFKADSKHQSEFLSKIVLKH
jgi:hypothetical protein